MEEQSNQQSSIVERLEFLKNTDALVPYDDCIDLITEAVHGKSTMPIADASKLFQYACIQCGRWEAKWLYSPVRSPNKRAKFQADKWKEISTVFFEALTKAMPDSKAAELLNEQRALIGFEPVMKRAVEYSESRPFEGFVMQTYARVGILVSSWGMKRLGRSFYERGFYPRGTVGHPRNSERGSVK